jgi:LPS sulfotransferase NodH
VRDWDVRPSSGRADFLGLLSADPTVSVLYLTRDNLIESLRSLTQAKRTGRWVACRAADLEDMPTVRLTPQMCHAYSQRAKRFTAGVQERFACHRLLPLTYEELCADPVVQVRRVQEFLGVPVQDLPASSLMKQESRPLSEVVENFVELREEFRGTQYGRFFE